MDGFPYLQKLPVAINNYYGDPILQWDNTVDKVRMLSRNGHRGPVGIITKGQITPAMAAELRQAAGDLKLVVLMSISGLPPEVEPVGQDHRYSSLQNVVEAGIAAVGYVRPFVPPYNTNAQTVDEMFRRIQESGCRHVVVSGFRGDDNIIDRMQPDEKQKWVLRVKVMPADVGLICRQAADNYGLQMFTRTSCGVAAALGLERSFNPYYNSPVAAGCEGCPINATCGHVVPDPDAMEFVRSLGYDVEYVSNSGDSCRVEPEDRLSCLSCCTSCFVLGVPRIVVKNSGVRLGDIAFIRFITGVLVSQDGVVDGGDPKVGHVSFPALVMPECEVHCINSWYVWARQMKKCYGCRYCITTVYDLKEREYGCSPRQLANYLEKLS